MSTEASEFTTQTTDQNVEVQQQAGLQSFTESDSDIEQVQEDVEDLTESAGFASTSDEPTATNTNIEPQQSSVQEGSSSLQDSQRSSVSAGASGLESQLGNATRSGSSTALQDGGSGTEPKNGETGVVDGQQSQERSGESQQGCVGGTQTPLYSAVPGTSRQNSQDSATAGGLSNDNSFVTAVGSSAQASLESSVAGGVSNSPDPEENAGDGTESFEGVAAPGARDEFREHMEERAQETEELMRSYDQCFNKCACVCDYLKPCSIRIRKSKIFMILKILLLVIPISAFCVGLKYLSQCPAGNELPILMMLMGIAGVVLITSGLGLHLRHVLCPSVRPIYFKSLIIASRVMLLAVFAAGLDSTYKMSPSFDPSNQNKYCDEVFYNYAYYTNFVVIGIAVLSFFIYVPSFNENIEEYEHL